MATTIATVLGYTFSVIGILLMLIIGIFGFIYDYNQSTEIQAGIEK